MSIFQLYFTLGIEHILDFKGYDHILFILALCGIYLLHNWQNILILVTAFTIGHSITLALAALSVITVHVNLIEFLIPVTIFITALYNIVFTRAGQTKHAKLIKYLSALFFGLIHGMGFSNYLVSLLGTAENVVTPLFAFNLGLELGQIIILAVILSTATFFIRILQVKHREWNLVISGAALGISFILLMERIPF